MENNEKISLEYLLIDSLQAEGLADISHELLELGLDSILEDGLLKDIPIVNSIVAVGKLGVAIKDRIFIKKLLRFLSNINNLPLVERVEFNEKLNEDKKFKKDLGEKLILLIDRADSMEKPGIIANLFSEYVKKDIDFPMFLRLARSVDKIDMSDFLELIAYYKDSSFPALQENGIDKFVLAENIFSSGLSSIDIFARRRSESHLSPTRRKPHDLYSGNLNRNITDPIDTIQHIYEFNDQAELLAKIILKHTE